MQIEFVDIQAEHLEMIRQWRNSAEVKKYMYSEQHITPEDQASWYETIKAETDEKHWLIEVEGKGVGVVNLKKIDLQNKTAEWAFYLGEVSARGSGIGALTEYRLLEYAFTALKLHKLNCAVLAFNTKVIDLHKKFGFSEEGRVRSQYLKNGEYVDVVLLGILAAEWSRQRDIMKSTIERLAR